LEARRNALFRLALSSLPKEDSMADKLNSEGRRANDAQPLGQRDGLETDESTQKTAERERRSAGPDGPDARDSVAGINPKAD
jgi:hypothetical protein